MVCLFHSAILIGPESASSFTVRICTEHKEKVLYCMCDHAKSHYAQTEAGGSQRIQPLLCSESSVQTPEQQIRIPLFRLDRSIKSDSTTFQLQYQLKSIVDKVF
jgi:hypothetical protein